MPNQSDKILSVDCRSLRDMGNSVGQTFDKEALRALGVVDDDGHVIDEVDARQVIFEDGTIEITIDTKTTGRRLADD